MQNTGTFSNKRKTSNTPFPQENETQKQTYIIQILKVLLDFFNPRLLKKNAVGSWFILECFRNIVVGEGENLKIDGGCIQRKKGKKKEKETKLKTWINQKKGREEKDQEKAEKERKR